MLLSRETPGDESYDLVTQLLGDIKMIDPEDMHSLVFLLAEKIARLEEIVVLLIDHPSARERLTELIDGI